MQLTVSCIAGVLAGTWLAGRVGVCMPASVVVTCLCVPAAGSFALCWHVTLCLCGLAAVWFVGMRVYMTLLLPFGLYGFRFETFRQARVGQACQVQQDAAMFGCCTAVLATKGVHDRMAFGLVLCRHCAY